MDALLNTNELNQLQQFLLLHKDHFQPPVTDFKNAAPIDLSVDANLPLSVQNNREVLGHHIAQCLRKSGTRYLYGGYNEHRAIYGTSKVFDGEAEPRRLHLGLDIWGDAGTIVYAPLAGLVHSFKYNNADGDYGATIVLSHSINGVGFYSLYGHLSLQNISNLREGAYFTPGEKLANFGTWEENGGWPPHLHFQLIADMDLYEGDYPGVCAFSQRDHWLQKSPDPLPLFL